MLLLAGGTAHAQCTNTSSYGSANVASWTVGTTGDFSTCSYRSEYSTMTGAVIGGTYTFTLVGGGYITVHSGTYNGPVLAHGPSPLSGVIANNATLYPHWNVNAACATDAGCKTTQVTYTAAPSPCSGTPTPGNTTGPAAVAAGGTANLGLQNTTVGTGVTYQWYVSTTSGSGPWTPVGPNAPTYSPTVSVDSWFYCDVTCTEPGGGTGSSNVLAVQTLSVTLVPMTGNNTAPCGTDFILQDNGGTGNYANSSNGYTVIEAGTGATINIAGNYATESGFDYIRIYDGVGIGGTLLATYAGSGAVNYTGTAAQTLTVQLTSDGSVQYPGFEFVVTFTGTCYASCSGMPNSGTASGPANVCIGNTATFSATGLTVASGISYQWEESPDGVSGWANEVGGVGGTTPTYTSTAVNATRHFRIRTICATGPDTAWSNVVTVAPFTDACQCSVYPAIYASSTADDEISNVTVGTLNNSSTCLVPAPGAGSILNRYGNYTGSVAPPDLQQASIVNFSLTQTSCGGNYSNGFQLYIDWNQDGDFLDTDEQVYNQPTNVIGTHTVNEDFTVPITALPGSTRMRVVNVEGMSPALNYAHTAYTWGETEDYCVNVTLAPVCSSTPVPGNTTGPATICPGVPFTLGLQNVPSESGITYQWWVSTDGSNYLPAGTGLPTLDTTQTVASWYYCDVTCTQPGGGTAASTVLPVAMTNFMSCYCTSGVGPTSTFDSQVQSVQLTGVPGSINYNHSCPGVVGVQDLTALTADLFVGDPYTVNVNFGTCGGSYTGVGEVWIDYDHSGSFEPGESLGTQGPAAPPGLANINFTVPGTAQLGITRMRVMQRESGSLPLDPCAAFIWGSVMDFSVNINVPTPCSGVPTPGNTLSTETLVCANESFTLSMQNLIMGTGVSYQWETSPDNMTWTPAVGAPPASVWTTTQSATTWYRCVVTCSGFGNAASTPIQVVMDSPSACMCIPTYTYGIQYGDLISEVEIIGTTLLNNSGTAVSPNIPYTYFTGAPNYTASLVAGTTYNIEVTIGSFTSQNVAVWIDFDENGIFDTPGERVGYFGPINTAFGSATFPLTLPCNPAPGVKRMRVRDVYATTASTIDPCIEYFYGETEDYDVTILPPPPCPAPGNLQAGNATGSTVDLTWNVACTETAWNIEWGLAGFTQGTGTIVPVTVTPFLQLTGLSPGVAYEAYVQADCAGNGTSTWVGPIAFSTCNGVCADAIPAVLGVNTTGPIDCGNGASNVGAVHARWFTYTATGTGVLTASACGAVNTGNNDTRLFIHGGTCGSLSVLSSSDDACAWAYGGSAYASTASVFVNSGQQVFIEWDDYWNPAGFDWELTFTPCTPDPADLCVNKTPSAFPITIGNPPTVFTGNLDCQQQDGIVPNPFPQATGWEWVAFELTQCANVQISYCGTPNFQYGALNMYGDCGTMFINSQTYNFTACGDGNPTIYFEDLSPGYYYYPVLWSLPLGMIGPYTVNVSATTPTNPCPTNINCAGAIALACPGSVTGNTNNQFPTLPATACPFTGGPTSGGSLWYTYTAAADENIVLSTCGLPTVFDTRISVFTGPDCNTLSCYTLSDDFGGACTNRSQLEFFAQGGQTYYIAVHSPSPFQDGAFELQVGCGAACPRPSNDDCGTPTVLTSYLADGSGVVTGGDNTCAQNDAFTTCTPVLNNQGVWYSFNSGVNSIHVLDLLGTNQNGALTATQLNYALFSGTCANLGAAGEVACDDDGDGYDIVLSGLTTNTDYLLYVYNPGATGFEGTFEVMVEHPALDDAGMGAVLAPTGLVCTSFLEPQVELINYGENTLTSVDIVYDLDGGLTGPFLYTWTGSLAYGDTVVVNLPGFTSPYGIHTLNVTTQNPNGQVDGIAANDAVSEPNVNVTGETVVVRITTDNDPTGIYWEVLDQLNNTVATAPAYGAANTTIDVTSCLTTLNGNCFSFYLYDFLGDGLSGMGNGNGSWSLRTPGGRVLLGDNFDGTLNGMLSPASPPATSGYVNGHEFCLPAGPSRIQDSECGIFTNILQNKVYATTVSGASTYQFEFSDPDAGFRRRIAVPRNWVKFSEMVTSPLQPGVTYFARVRVDQGIAGFTDDRFGTGCEMGLDPSAVPGCTGLVDDIGTPAHSCGVTKTFGGSDKVWAQPVVGATQYRFKFENAGESYLRTIVRPNYICPLSWVTLPLQNGVTYDVSVEVLYNGQWSGYCGPVCQVTILNPPAMAQQRDAQAVTHGGMQVWPNPVRDGRVNIRLDGLTAATQRVSLEVYDLTGKRVVARDLENSGPVFNTVLDLDGFAGGVYMVHLNVDGTVHQQRVSVVK